MTNELIKIKNKYGEKMDCYCEDMFLILLEKEGLLSSILETYFPNTTSLYDDLIANDKLEEFKNYLYSLVDVEKKEIILKTPEELMSDAGYYLYECHSEKDIQFFKRFYAVGEELCTFKGNRLDNCYVFFALKKNVNDIKRENFPNPQRQDEYGTSVISIQFAKGLCNTVSIKNRYNHRVENPDATFSNNLDNIIMGLTKSFENEYNLNISNQKKFYIPGYVSIKGIYYKYNYKINGIYYCPNNIIIKDGKVIEEYLDTSKYLVMDYYIVDLENKEIKLFDQNIEDIINLYLNGISNIKIVIDEEDIKYIIFDKKRKIICDKDNTIMFLEMNKRLFLRDNIGLRKRFKDKNKEKKKYK